MNLYEYALGGIRTHETGLYQARGSPDTPPGRPVRPIKSYRMWQAELLVRRELVTLCPNEQVGLQLVTEPYRKK